MLGSAVFPSIAQLHGILNAHILPSTMRVRILKQTQGVLDGVSLSRFVPGLVYDVPASLGAFLVVQQAAVEDMTATVAVVTPLTEESAALTGGVSVSPSLDRAADKPRRKQDKQP